MTKQFLKKPQRPVDPLIRPWTNPVGDIKHLAVRNASAIHRNQSGEAFKQCCLPGAVRSDQAEQLAFAHGEARLIQHQL